MKRALFGFFLLSLLLALVPASLEAAPFLEPAPSCAVSGAPEAAPVPSLAELLAEPGTTAKRATTCEPVSCQQECAASCGCPGGQGTCGGGRFGSFCVCLCPQCAIVPFP